MKQLTGSGRRNPMVQRLQRYTAMPAIFRAVDTPVMPAAVPDGSLEPVVKTFILPPHTFAAPPAELVSAPETAVSPEAAVQTAGRATTVPRSHRPANATANTTRSAANTHPAHGRSYLASCPDQQTDRTKRLVTSESGSKTGAKSGDR